MKGEFSTPEEDVIFALLLTAPIFILSIQGNGYQNSHTVSPTLSHEHPSLSCLI